MYFDNVLLNAYLINNLINNKKFGKCTPTAKKTCFTRQFYFRDEKVIFLDRSRLPALIVLIFSHDMQIQVAHALCKHGCRLISYTANIRLVTIAACYNCPRSPLPAVYTHTFTYTHICVQISYKLHFLRIRT